MGRKVDVKNSKRCKCCKKRKNFTSFYRSKNLTMFPDGYLDTCKDCIENVIDYTSEDSIREVLKSIDVPYDEDIWKHSINKNKQISLGVYLRNINTKGKGLLKRDYTENEVQKEKEGKNGIELLPDQRISKTELKRLKRKFGGRYTDEEYALFEEKYNDVVDSFDLKNKMQEEYLKEWCIDKVKGDLAKSIGDIKTAKDFSAMAATTAKEGNLSPKELLKTNLAEGVESFSQLSSAVEQTPQGEIMNILPIFKERPKDKVDVTLKLILDYQCKLVGKEPPKYSDVWKFYDERIDNYLAQMSDTLLKENKINVEHQMDRGIDANLELKDKIVNSGTIRHEADKDGK